MSMTQKHYVEIAAILKSAGDQHLDEGDNGSTGALVLQDITAELASFFKRDNSSFSYSRFFEAAGVAVPARFAGRR
jgi:hypothetical protein